MYFILLFILLLQFCGASSVNSELSQIMLQLNTAYNINLNIFINLDYTSPDMVDLQHLETPQIQLQLSDNSSIDFWLFGTFTEKSLIVAYIKEPPLDASLVKLLPSLLRFLYDLNIVFITTEEPGEWQKELYSFCFQTGFINVLLIHKLNHTLTLYSYNPYPEVRVLKLLQVGDYFNRWHQLQNLQHQPIRTIFFTVVPRTMTYVDRKGRLVRGGYMHNIFVEFARHHNATLTIVKDVPNADVPSTALTMMRNREIDVLFTPKEYGVTYPSTTALYIVKMHITVPHARPIASYLYFTRPFTWTLWLAVIGTMGYGMLMLYVSSGRNGRSEIGKHFLSSWCHFLFVGQPSISIFNWQQFVIHFILMLSGFILTSFYLAQLSSMLTSGLFERQYNTLEDLFYAPYPLYMAPYYENYLRGSNSLPPELLSHIVTDPPNIVDDARIAMNTSYMFIGYDDRNDGVLYQQHLLRAPLFKEIKVSVLDGLMSFVVLPGLPYLNILNIYLRTIFERGILAKIKSDAWRETIDSGITKLIRDNEVDLKPYDLEFYYYAFGLWAVGLGLSSLCFLLELLRKKISK